jgi:large conductance mechanosensitive channel
MRMLKEFREFAMKGNMLDLAIGVVIGAAFGKIVDSLVKDVIMPPIGMLTGGVDFSDQKLILKDAVLNPDGSVKTPENSLNWGLFLNAIVSFIIVAFALFLIVKGVNRMRRAQEEAPAEVPIPNDELLLAEIRDLLKNK